MIWLVLIRGTVGGKESCVWIRSLSTMQGLATAMKPKVGLQPIRHMVGIILSPFANPHELVMPSLSFAFCLWCNLSTTKLSAGCWQSGINKVFLIVAVQVLLPLHHVCDITYTLVLLFNSQLVRKSSIRVPPSVPTKTRIHTFPFWRGNFRTSKSRTLLK